MIIDNVPGTAKPIEYLYAWLSVDENGLEGIVAGVDPPMPLVTSRLDLILKYQPMVQQIATGSCRTCRLVRFGPREIIRTVYP